MIDKYTKAVLTVIAVCLCVITVQMTNIIPAAQAADDKIHKIAICNLEGNCAAITKNGILPIINFGK